MCLGVQRYCKLRENQNKRGKFALFLKKMQKNFGVSRKSSTFALAFREMLQQSAGCTLNIGVWCNGNTTDSGPVILGSSPSTPTEKKKASETEAFLFYSLFSASIALIFSRMRFMSSFSFCTLRFISSIRLLPFFELTFRKPRLFS